MSAAYEIEKGIPAPSPQGERCKYPFRKMEVGDSFFVPCEHGNAIELAVRASARPRDEKKFTVSRVEGGVRVWRVA